MIPDADAFPELCRLIGSYAAMGAIFDPPVSPQGVAKWASAGIPPERVLPLARAVEFQVTPHRMRPDIYPHPEDGLPAEKRGSVAVEFDRLLDELTPLLRFEEAQRLRLAVEQGPGALIREIESIEVATDIRAQLLQAAQCS